MIYGIMSLYNSRSVGIESIDGANGQAKLDECNATQCD